MSGADMLVQVLADEGVDTIFGYSGGAILPIYDAVFRVVMRVWYGYGEVGFVFVALHHLSWCDTLPPGDGFTSNFEAILAGRGACGR